MSQEPLRVMVLSAQIEPNDPDVASRLWERALVALEEIIPELESPYIGLCTARARGPARYYGSEEKAASIWLLTASQQGFSQASVGVADGVFVATQAALVSDKNPEIQCPSPGVRIVPSARTAAFLSDLPVESVATTELAEVFTELGVRTLGALTALPEAAVHERFGSQGLQAHRLARGLSPHSSIILGLARSFPEHRSTLTLESPLDDSEQLAFASRTHADSFLRSLTQWGLVCTELRIELIDDADAIHARNWAHPMSFTSMDITNRIRWQAADIPSNSERSAAGIIEIVFIAARVARAADHEPGLWNAAPDERIHHHLTRLQNLLGFENVCIGVLSGGRFSNARQQLLPWGSVDASPSQISAPSLPWPGHIPGVPPSMVFTDPPSAALWDSFRQAVHVDHEDFLTADPAFLSRVLEHTPQRVTPVTAWSKPWPVNERWWMNTHTSNMSYRLQVLLQDGTAWLLQYQQSAATWVIEGCYD